MVELQSKIDADYKKPLEPWENERWENLEEVRWKGRRSFQGRCEPRGGWHPSVTTAVAPVASSEEEEDVRFLPSARSSASLSVDSGNDENQNQNQNENRQDGAGGVDNDDNGLTPEPALDAAAAVGRSVLAPIANANSSELLSSPARIPSDTRIRNDDGEICDCSCCRQGSRSFIDRDHRMRYLFGEGG